VSSSPDRLSVAEILSYSLPAFGASALVISVALYLPNFYTDELGVTAGMVGWVYLAGRVWDAVTDPVMGHVSDHTRTRWGRRRPWFLLSALPLWAAFYMLWSPPAFLSQQALFAHLIVWYLILYTVWTVFWIPYVSFGMEITPHYHERTRLFGGRQLFYMGGLAAGMLLPEVFTKLAGDAAKGYSRMAVAMGALAAGLILFGFVRLKERPRGAAVSTFPFFAGLRLSFRNRAFVILLFVYVTAVVGGSFIAPLTLYVAKYVIVARWVVPWVMLAYLVGSIASIPVWVRLASRIGKNRTWMTGMVVGTIGYATSYAYHEGTWLLWIVLAFVVGAANGCTMTLGLSLSADVIDSDELSTGQRREGAFMGIWSFADKAAVGLAVFVGMQGLEAIGYAPNAVQSQTVIDGIKFLYCALPAACHALALLIFLRFPITPEVYQDIRARLDARAVGG